LEWDLDLDEGLRKEGIEGMASIRKKKKKKVKMAMTDKKKCKMKRAFGKKKIIL
jgi:hypothetical protein